MTSSTAAVPRFELDDVLASFRFRERHRRRVDLPIERVWPAALAVTPREVRTFGPFTALRELPSRLARSGEQRLSEADRPMLEGFIGQGFLPVRSDAAPHDGRGLVLFCAAGRFWSPAKDAAIHFTTVEDFLSYDEPGRAKIAATLEAIDGGGHTELVTETRVMGTDAAANRAFAAYWALIRLPSGLIRRSWLAAIARRANAQGQR